LLGFTGSPALAPEAGLLEVQQVLLLVVLPMLRACLRPWVQALANGSIRVSVQVGGAT
jgi:hypothetical protein